MGGILVRGLQRSTNLVRISIHLSYMYISYIKIYFKEVDRMNMETGKSKVCKVG